MPTRRRDATMPIDSSTRIASRATLRDTAYSWQMPSSVSTCPAASSPAAIRRAERGEHAGVLCRRRGTVVTETSCHLAAYSRKEQVNSAQSLAKI